MPLCLQKQKAMDSFKITCNPGDPAFHNASITVFQKVCIQNNFKVVSNNGPISQTTPARTAGKPFMVPSHKTNNKLYNQTSEESTFIPSFSVFPKYVVTVGQQEVILRIQHSHSQEARWEVRDAYPCLRGVNCKQLLVMLREETKQRNLDQGTFTHTDVQTHTYIKYFKEPGRWFRIQMTLPPSLWILLPSLGFTRWKVRNNSFKVVYYLHMCTLLSNSNKIIMDLRILSL